ncbi:MAG: helix-turn-helix transcriptional regulator [Clostridia bacterium]|nr:helix-turn-helix transcriptional regulator [Clostridia bacterium]
MSASCRVTYGRGVKNLSECAQFRLLYFVQGAGRLLLRGENTPITPGTLCLLPPSSQAILESGAEGFELYTITFTPDALTVEGVACLDELCQSGWCLVNAPKATLECVEKVENATKMTEPEGALLAKLALTELLVHLRLSKGKADGVGEGEPLAIRLKRYLDENFTAPHLLDDLAKIFFVSKYYLCRSFKMHYGVSVHHYLNRCRIEAARRLMSRGETASAAAYHVGFGDYSSFYRTFKKMMGYAPTETPPDAL